MLWESVLIDWHMCADFTLTQLWRAGWPYYTAAWRLYFNCISKSFLLFLFPATLIGAEMMFFNIVHGCWEMMVYSDLKKQQNKTNELYVLSFYDPLSICFSGYGFLLIWYRGNFCKNGNMALSVGQVAALVFCWDSFSPVWLVWHADVILSTPLGKEIILAVQLERDRDTSLFRCCWRVLRWLKERSFYCMYLLYLYVWPDGSCWNMTCTGWEG